MNGRQLGAVYERRQKHQSEIMLRNKNAFRFGVLKQGRRIVAVVAEESWSTQSGSVLQRALSV